MSCFAGLRGKANMGCFAWLRRKANTKLRQLPFYPSLRVSETFPRQNWQRFQELFHHRVIAAGS